MKTEVFLNKLKKEKRLGLVEPNINIKKSYFEKSESNIISSKALLKIDRLEEATSLAYYSAYHSLLALLYGIGIKCENHTASIILLKEIFDLDNSFILFAKKERVDKQYYVSFKITKREVEDLIKEAESFNEIIIEFTSRLNNEKINFYRNKFKILLKIK